MLKSSSLMLSALCLAVVCSAGCYVETAPVAPAAEGDVVVDPPPPPPPVAEAPPAPAAPGMVWVAGAHRWDGHAYVWQKGHYDRPPRAQSRFIQGHWEAHGRGKVWVNGHWG